VNRKAETISLWHGRLPHWEVVDGRYFVAIHLAGAMPAEGQNRIHTLAAELSRVPKIAVDARIRVQRRVFAEMEAWLDRAEHANYLRRADVAEIVMESIAFRQGQAWNMFEYVVMPSHLHLFFEILQGDLKSILEQFKRWKGHEAGKLLQLKADRFWQDEWFDHWSRSDEEDEKIAEYIRQNPVKAKLVENRDDWPFGSWSN
jgi:REP element-mobilizing transposase RayT